ncbi:MAG: CapA family protein, partial [Gammaproteobacteria bacterium]|nr:CapA family protein [Gammaproteobacteria bacterium]
DALAEFARVAPDVRLVNLETSITTSDEYWPGKGIHYRLHPDNARCLAEAGIDACTLANNHVLDYGYAGLAETLTALRRTGIECAGAGTSAAAAAVPAVIDTGRGRLIVYSYGLRSSGIPPDWSAGADRGGVNYLDALSSEALEIVAGHIKAVKRDGDVAVVSLHWGSNWGDDIPREHQDFAHRLVDEAGADLVHGHSSHHPRAIEVYNGKLILYGTGDFINDYEGIGGHDKYRGDLVMMYFASVEVASGRLVDLTMVPMQIRRLQPRYASRADASYLAALLSRVGKRFGSGARLGDDNRLHLEWQRDAARERGQ